MRQSFAIALAAALIGAAALPARAADAAHPTVVELFQSQGCSSCPPANANLIAAAGRADVLPLAFQVTYWDHLGWKDTFGDAAHTARQWDYARAFRRKNVFTPQVVVNGRVDGVGATPADFAKLVRHGDRGAGGPSVSLSGGAVDVSAGKAPAKPADVWLVRYDPRTVQVPIRTGENGGKTLPHRNVVKEIARLGSWRGEAVSLTLPAAKDPALKTAILVQGAKGGPILAAARL